MVVALMLLGSAWWFYFCLPGGLRVYRHINSGHTDRKFDFGLALGPAGGSRVVQRGRQGAGSAARLVTGPPGSALAGRDSHPLDDCSDFQRASPSLLPVRPGFPDRCPIIPSSGPETVLAPCQLHGLTTSPFRMKSTLIGSSPDTYNVFGSFHPVNALLRNSTTSLPGLIRFFLSRGVLSSNGPPPTRIWKTVSCLRFPTTFSPLYTSITSYRTSCAPVNSPLQ